jgi:hypothetical protein
MRIPRARVEKSQSAMYSNAFNSVESLIPLEAGVQLEALGFSTRFDVLAPAQHVLFGFLSEVS